MLAFFAGFIIVFLLMNGNKQSNKNDEEDSDKK